MLMQFQFRSEIELYAHILVTVCKLMILDNEGHPNITLNISYYSLFTRTSKCILGMKDSFKSVLTKVTPEIVLFLDKP